MRVESIHPRYLSASDVAAWRSFLRADPELSSPYLTPDWAKLVAVHRSDVRVAVYRIEAGEPLGFLPVQRCGDFAAMPAGGPICDYQALAAKPGVTLDLAMAPKALSVGRIDLTAGLMNNAVGSRLLTSDAGHVVRFVGGYEAWCAERLAAGTKTIAKTRKKLAKMTRDLGGAVTFDAFSTDPHAFLKVRLAEAGLPHALAFMTSRDICRHHLCERRVEGVAAACLTTVGLSNGERVGSRKAYGPPHAGTINTLVHVSVPLTDGAMVEALSIVAEARTAAIVDSWRAARGTTVTGTGTDCIVVASPCRGEPLAFAGLHTAVGEAIGGAVYDATRSGAEQWDRDFPQPPPQ